jgi:ATP adenylyltransferase/5',5'''-P-1,P-4-tetraphosphate phosphorylase II
MFVPDERLIITQLNGTHDLALNLFCVDRPQLLIPTRDSYLRQYQPLDSNDFTVALEVLRRMPSMYLMYNCSEAGGCSRMHKHMQGLRGPPYAFDTLTSASSAQSEKAPFQYYAHCFDQGFNDMSTSDLLDVYMKFLDQTFRVLGLAKGEVCPHNVVLWKDWLIVTPRRKGIWNGASANAAGMAGSIWVPEKKHVDDWLRLGSANVLRELGIPPKMFLS